MGILTTIRGFKDILPAETGKWHYVEETARNILTAFSFREIRLPLLEKTELFSRGIGATTDIVEKEMYTFLDRDKEYLTPERTCKESGPQSNNPGINPAKQGKVHQQKNAHKEHADYFQIDSEKTAPQVGAGSITYLVNRHQAYGLHP